MYHIFFVFLSSPLLGTKNQKCVPYVALALWCSVDQLGRYITLKKDIQVPLLSFVFSFEKGKFALLKTPCERSWLSLAGRIGARFFAWFFFPSLSIITRFARKITWRTYRRHAGPSRVRTRIPSTRGLGQRVSLRKILRCLLPCAITTFPVSLLLSLLLAMSSRRVYLLFPPRGRCRF